MVENIALLPEFAAQYPFLWGSFLFLSGLAFGSFFNVVIHRLPLMMEQAEGINLCFPASFCPQCREPIAWRDNIPLLGFLFLKGRSRCCGQPISPRYPLMELATGALFVLAGYLMAPACRCWAG